MSEKFQGERQYTVIEYDHALAIGVPAPSMPDYAKFALVAMRGEKLDTFLAWCYNKENAERIAHGRNYDMSAMRATMERTLIREDASSMPAGEPPADAPKKRGRPKKNVDTENEAC